MRRARRHWANDKGLGGPLPAGPLCSAGAVAPARLAGADRAGRAPAGKHAGRARARPRARQLHGCAAHGAEALRRPGRQHRQTAAGPARRAAAGVAVAVVAGLRARRLLLRLLARRPRADALAPARADRPEPVGPARPAGAAVHSGSHQAGEGGRRLRGVHVAQTVQQPAGAQAGLRRRGAGVELDDGHGPVPRRHRGDDGRAGARRAAEHPDDAAVGGRRGRVRHCTDQRRRAGAQPQRAPQRRGQAARAGPRGRAEPGGRTCAAGPRAARRRQPGARRDQAAHRVGPAGAGRRRAVAGAGAEAAEQHAGRGAPSVACAAPGAAGHAGPAGRAAAPGRRVRCGRRHALHGGHRRRGGGPARGGEHGAVPHRPGGAEQRCSPRPRDRRGGDAALRARRWPGAGGPAGQLRAVAEAHRELGGQLHRHRPVRGDLGLLPLPGRRRPAGRHQHAVAAVRHRQPDAGRRRADARHGRHLQDEEGPLRLGHHRAGRLAARVHDDGGLAEDLLCRPQARLPGPRRQIRHGHRRRQGAGAGQDAGRDVARRLQRPAGRRAVRAVHVRGAERAGLQREGHPGRTPHGQGLAGVATLPAGGSCGRAVHVVREVTRPQLARHAASGPGHSGGRASRSPGVEWLVRQGRPTVRVGACRRAGADAGGAAASGRCDGSRWWAAVCAGVAS
ncbi:unnamed protein product [Rotaria sp. Silwood1]|nr:unnamed protein product [Rotaria sp. Silwood1]